MGRVLLWKGQSKKGRVWLVVIPIPSGWSWCSNSPILILKLQELWDPHLMMWESCWKLVWPKLASCCYKEQITDHGVLLLSLKKKHKSPHSWFVPSPARVGAAFLWYSNRSNCTNTLAYYKRYWLLVLAAAACCPEVSWHPASCWTLTWKGGTCAVLLFLFLLKPQKNPTAAD